MNWRIVITKTFVEFGSKRPFLHCAALAYYAVLAIIPIIYLSISYYGFLFGKDEVTVLLEAILREEVGLGDVSGIEQMISGVDVEKGNALLEFIGVLVLLFSASTILNSIRKSLNDFFDLGKLNLRKRDLILKGLLSRLIYMLFIVVLTVVVIGAFFAETLLLNFFDDKLYIVSDFLALFLQFLFPIALNLFLFTLIFKFLSDAAIPWKLAMKGGLVTGVLMFIGQTLIKYYLSNYFLLADAGVSASFLILLVWVFYSALIFYLGAQFIATYARQAGIPIEARSFGLMKKKVSRKDFESK